LLLAVEIALRLASFGHPTTFLLRTQVGQETTLVQNDWFTTPYFGRHLVRQPFPIALPTPKPNNTIRIFVFGESAAYGDPQPAFGLPRMVEALLSERFPEIHFEVVNAAMTAINSHVISRIAHDCSRYEGDAWIVYMGNNEVVGPFGAGTVFGAQAPNRAYVRTVLALKETRTGQLLERLSQRIHPPPAENQEWGGMRMFLNHQVRHESPQMTTVYANFEQNLKDIIETGRQAGVRVFLGTVASNLKDCAPFSSVHRDGLSPGEAAEWNRLYKQALEFKESGRLAEALALLEQVSRIDDSYAQLRFAFGECCLALHQPRRAAEHFTAARDLDTLRFRADSRINRIIQQTTERSGQEAVTLVDTQNVLAQQSPHELVGNEFLYEHVHLRFQGNYLLARAFAEAVAEQLPILRATRSSARPWPTSEACATRLAWTTWSQREGIMAMLARVSEPPFDAQQYHAELQRHLSLELDQLRSATTPAALSQSASLCESATKQAPADWVLLKEFAAIQQETGDSAGSIESWRRILQRLPHYTEGWQALGRNLLAQRLEGQAIEALHEALKLDPDSVSALTALAQALEQQGDRARSLAVYERVLSLKPYWSPAHLGMGKALQTMGRTHEAKAHFRKALESRLLTPPALCALAAVCFEQGWFAEAYTNFTDAIRLEPADPATHLNLGITLDKLGRRAEAQAQFAEALRLDPASTQARVRLGIQLGRQGQDTEALHLFEEAVRLDPNLLEARLNLGVALMRQGRNADALGQFQELLHRYPSNAIALGYVQRLTAAAAPTQPRQP
jgi:tetratricopeptide (TPR) repeat protein